ncbi:MAG TPA: lysophospholipid acyltransferase family protein [Thermoanaerobaculia bacterium]|nr:lysophospholipid acyltransferase family protein [Thermoanaerobaculia bacterium]
MGRSRLQRLKNGLIYAALRAGSSVGVRMSLSSARSIGKRTGAVACALLQKERRKALESLSIAFPELEPEARDRLARSSFAHLGCSLLEIAWLPNLSHGNLDETTSFEGLGNLRDAVAIGRGVVLFTGHCGNWEWLAAAIGLSGLSMNVIARELYDPRLNDFIVASRGRHDIATIGRGSSSSAREVLRTLRGGAILGLMIDQNIRVQRVMVPFFGRPAPTPIGPAKLAIRAGAVAIAGFIERRGDRQHVRFEPPIETSRATDATELTARMTAAVEQQIRRVPEQWVWMHQRWRDRG